MNFDLLVIANPVWETTWVVDSIDLLATSAGERSPEFSTSQITPACADGGGSALNTACALAMAGRKVMAVGRVGDDAEGQAAVAALRRRGVETSVEVVAGRTTKRNHLYVESATAATAFQVDLPPLSVPPWDEDPAALLEARVLWLDRLAASSVRWLQARRSRPECINGLNRNSGVGTAAGEERFWRALPSLDYLQIPEREEDLVQGSSGSRPKEGRPSEGRGKGGRGQNESPVNGPSRPADPIWPDRPPAKIAIAAALSEVFDPRKIHRPSPMRPLAESQVAAILRGGPRVLLRTRGSRGVLLHLGTPRDPEFAEIPALPTHVVDPTGAGDAFAAGFLDGMIEKLTPVESAQRGVNWAARACRYPGARGWLDHEPPIWRPGPLA